MEPQKLEKYRYISEKHDVMNFDFIIFQVSDKYLDIVVNNKEYNRIKKDNFEKLIARVIDMKNSQYLVLNVEDDIELYNINKMELIKVKKLKKYKIIHTEKGALFEFLKEAYNKKIAELIENNQNPDGFINGLIMINQQMEYNV